MEPRQQEELRRRLAQCALASPQDCYINIPDAACLWPCVIRAHTMRAASRRTWMSTACSICQVARARPVSFAHNRAVHQWDMRVHRVQAIPSHEVAARSDGYNTCLHCQSVGGSPSLAGLHPRASPPPLRGGRSRSSRRTSPSSPSARQSCRQPPARQQKVAATKAAMAATAAAALAVAASRPHQTQVPSTSLQLQSLSSQHAQNNSNKPVRPRLTIPCDSPTP